ncbi:MAG: DUF4392 domain-containing protein [Chloroflexi bacterium]|nr:DUF4392 domain-containing protein [Chloroflexota bacterium]
MTSIEDIILDSDRRGVSALRPYLPADYCTQAACYILEHPGAVLIATGFYILAAGAPETDGPPGAVALGRALGALGNRVAFVVDSPSLSLLRGLLGPSAEVVDFPITDEASSDAFAKQLLAQLRPSLLVAIERCGRTAEGLYLNMRGRDISPYNARLDYIFQHHPHTVGIGDGGNEIGMGNLASVIPSVPSLPQQPAVTRVSRLVIASVSNWGCYGVIAALSHLTGRNLLPSPQAEGEVLRRAAQLGAVDSIALKAVPQVDGFTVEENSAVLQRLHGWLRANPAPASGGKQPG